MGRAGVTGIQHRWDCPVKRDGAAPWETVVIVGTADVRRCRHCHRAAAVTVIVHTEEAQQP
jgi:hypothetical protein